MILRYIVVNKKTKVESSQELTKVLKRECFRLQTEANVLNMLYDNLTCQC